MRNKALLITCIALILPLSSSIAQVLGPCGTGEAETPSAALKQEPVQSTRSFAQVSRLPLPGERAPNFELSAITGNNEVKKIKLSDFDGKWRVVCFYPADFTFV